MGDDLTTYRLRIGQFLPRISSRKQKSSSSLAVRFSCSSFCFYAFLLFPAMFGMPLFETQSQSSLPLKSGIKLINSEQFMDIYNFLGFMRNVNFIARYTYGNRNKGGLKIMHWNAGGGFLKNKMGELESVIQKYHPHVFGISESVFRENHDINDVSVAGYDVYFSKSLENPTINLSRLSVFVHKDVQKVKVRHDLMDNDFSSIWLEIGLLRQKPLLVGNIYREWQYLGQNDNISLTTGAQFDRFSKFVGKWETAIEDSSECHLLGDMNLNFLEYNKNAIPFNSQSYKLRKLINLMFERIFPLGVVQCVTSATRISQNNENSGLDHYFTTEPNKLSEVQTIANGSSDHKIIFATRFSKIVPRHERIIRKRSFKNFDNAEFLKRVRNICWWNLYSSTDVDEVVKILSNEISNILDDLAPLKTFQVRSNYAPWLSVSSKQWIKFRDSALETAASSRLQADWAIYKKLRNKVTNLLKTEKKNWQKSKLVKLAGDSANIWKLAKSWLGWTSGGPPRQLCVNGVMINKPIEIAETLNEFFINKVNNIVNRLPKSHYDPLKLVRKIMTNKSCTFKLSSVHPDDVEKIISQLKNSKACGLDNIGCSVIKLAKPELVPALTHAVNLSIQQGKFPEVWKTAKIIPLHKKNDSTSPQNYRPVALLAVFSKILERAIFLQIVKYMNDNLLFHPSQHGFRKNHNTTTAILEMMDQWVEAMDRKNVSASVMLDLSAAFDMVDTDILLQKLKIYGFEANAIMWLQSYLTDRQQQVYVDGHLSKPLPVTLGVPQGSILGPLLYSIYTNDLPEVIHEHDFVNSTSAPFNLPCDECGGICSFADDSTLTISSANPDDLGPLLSNRYDLISNYMLGNRLALNNDKTHFMVIASQNQHRRNDNFGITLNTGTEIVAPSESERILGLNVQNDLSWNNHIINNEKSLSKSLSRKISALGKICLQADFRTRKMLANGLVISNIIYMVQVYGQASDYLLHILQVQQNRAAQIVTRLGWRTSTSLLLNQIGWLSVRQLYVYHSLLLLWKIRNSGNPQYLNEKFVQRFNYSTRQATSNSLSIYSTPRSEMSKKSFVFNTTILWNSLSTDLRKTQSLMAFKRNLRSWVKSNVEI